MSERNVEALARLICNPEVDVDPCPRCLDVASDLASLGVLVVSTLTDSEAAEIGYLSDDAGATDHTEERAARVRAALWRLATGESSEMAR